MTEQQMRAAVVAQARAWLDAKIKEADGSHREIIDLYNQHRQPGTYKMSYADPWCACFVSAVGMAVGLGDVLLPHVNCDGMIAAYKAAGRWVEDDGYLPAPGDLIFYDWQDPGAGDCTGSADHVGMIVADNDHYFTVIEGNYSDAVKERTLAHNSRYIRGFAVPDYAAAGGSSPSPTEEDGTPGAAILDRPDGAVVAGKDNNVPTVPDNGSGIMASPEPVSVIDNSRVTVALPVLRYGDGLGDHREDVRAAQLLLIGRGYRCGYAGPDGEYGEQTQKAVMAFQRGYGLAVDRVIGAETWAALLGVRK